MKRSGSMKYPLTNEVLKDRNDEDTIKQMMEAANSKKPIFSVKCSSQLINLVHYDIIYGCIADSCTPAPVLRNNLLQRGLAIQIKLDCFLNILFHKSIHSWLILKHLIKL